MASPVAPSFTVPGRETGAAAALLELPALAEVLPLLPQPARATANRAREDADRTMILHHAGRYGRIGRWDWSPS